MGIAELLVSTSTSIVARLTSGTIKSWFGSAETAAMIAEVRAEIAADRAVLDRAERADVTPAQLRLVVDRPPNGTVLMLCAKELVQYQKVVAEVRAYRKGIEDQLTAGAEMFVAGPQQADAQQADTEQADAEQADAQQADAQQADAQQADAQQADAQPADAQPADAQPADAQQADAQPADAQPAEPGRPEQQESEQADAEAAQQERTAPVQAQPGQAEPTARVSRFRGGGAERRARQALEEYRSSVDEQVREFLAQDPGWQDLQVQRKAAADQLRAALRRQLLEIVRRDLNHRVEVRERHARYRQRLVPDDAPGLRDEEGDPVETSATLELGRFLCGSRGSIGLAGPRGSGKSTLLRGTYEAWPRQGIRVLLPAPASYVPREFLVHLYVEICEHVLGHDQDGNRRPRSEPYARTRLAAPVGSVLTFVVLPAVAALVGVCLVLAYATTAHVSSRQAALGGVLLTVGLVPLVLRLIEKRALPAFGDRGSTEQRLLARGVLGWSQPRISGLLFAIGAGGVLLMLSAAGVAPDQLTTRRAAGAALLVAGLGTAAFRHRARPTYPAAGGGSPTAAVLESGARRLVLLMAIAAAQVVAVVAGAALLLTPPDVDDPDARLVAGALLTAAGAVALRAGLAVRPFLDRTRVPPATAEDDPVTKQARDGLRRLLYLRSELSGWTGAVKLGGGSWLPIGVDATASGSITEAEVPLGVPQIVKQIVDLLEQRGPALVAIDELDKIESAEKARDLLSELKPLFTAANAFFLVSMSEDAIANFERRGLPFRDVFDSAFDEVLPIPYLTFDNSITLINDRVLYVPPPFIALAYCLSGGLARDLIRTTRRMVNRGGDLEEVARDLVHGELRGKTAAVTSAIRSVLLEPESSAVLRALGRLDTCPPAGPRARPCLLDDDWLAVVDALGTQLQAAEGAAPTDVGDRRTLRRLGMELVGYHYYCRTLLELFVVTEDDALDRLVRAIEAQQGRVLDLLARARQDFTLSPYLVWERVTECRELLGLRPYATPPSLLASASTTPAAPELPAGPEPHTGPESPAGPEPRAVPEPPASRAEQAPAPVA